MYNTSGYVLIFDCLCTGFLLDKKIGVNQPKRIENAKILVANTPMDTDKIKVRHKIHNINVEILIMKKVFLDLHVNYGTLIFI